MRWDTELLNEVGIRGSEHRTARSPGPGAPRSMPEVNRARKIVLT
jgi:hypothetical protein